MRLLATLLFLAGAVAALLLRTGVVARAQAELAALETRLAPLVREFRLAVLPPAPGPAPRAAPRVNMVPDVLPPPMPVPAPGPEPFVVVLVGDTGLNGSFQPVLAGHGLKYGMRVAWAESSSGLRGLLTGDVNFANLETVVTDRNDLAANLKMFGFRMHPDGVRHLVAEGFNLFSTANNHAMDYGSAGARETLHHLGEIGVAAAGLGLGRDGARMPAVLTVRGRRVALAALGLTGTFADAEPGGGPQPGQLSPYSSRDMQDALETLAAAQADLRILSLHQGEEFDVLTSKAMQARMAQALDQGADLIAGHHQHVVAGVEIVGGKPVFHGLGNFLHLGTQDMDRHGLCHDYGLVARVHYAARPGERLELQAIEALPITNMHMATRRLPPSDAAARIHVLNHLSAKLGATGVRFAIEADGTGLACQPGASDLTSPIAARCRTAPAFTSPDPDLAARITNACATRLTREVPVVE